MDDFSKAFDDRLQEIEAYLDLLDALEKQVQEGPPRLGTSGPAITVQQQRILYSSVYLQLYNLTESTVNRCIEALSDAVTHQRWLPNDLSIELRREWVRFVARTHFDLTPENRLQYAMNLCEHLVNVLPISTFNVDKGGGGSWDDVEIYKLSQRLGLPLILSNEANRVVKQKFRDDKGALELIKQLRNSLAHGQISFAECGEGITARELRDLKERTAKYLKEVVDFFKSSIEANAFISPERRP